MSNKLCELCRNAPATVPDRNRTGRLVNRVCSSCHAARLRGDLANIVAERNRRLTPNEDINNAPHRTDKA